jgi:hypothetical protein
MDPITCYLDMYAAMKRKDFAAASDLALALKAWLDRGGFYPPNYTATEVKGYLASVLRRTAHAGE